jgi:hypothetical protein
MDLIDPIFNADTLSKLQAPTHNFIYYLFLPSLILTLPSPLRSRRGRQSRIQWRILTRRTLNFLVRFLHFPNQIKPITRIFHLPLNTQRLCYLRQLAMFPAHQDVPGAWVSFCCFCGSFDVVAGDGEIGL